MGNYSEILNTNVNNENFKPEVNHRSVRDRFKHLRAKAIQKRNCEEKEPGITGEHSELDDPLDELDMLFKESDQERDLTI